MRKIVGIGHSKHRSTYAAVGIEADADTKKVYIKMAVRWYREDYKNIPSDIGQMYNETKWDGTYVNQRIGEHFIKNLKKQSLPISVVTTQKDLKDPDELHRLKVMDTIEIVGLFLEQKQKHNIIFPDDDESDEDIVELLRQVSMFSEHITEAGNVDYYAKGEEHDDLVKALLLALFAVRNILAGSVDDNSLIFYGWNKKSHLLPNNNLANFSDMEKLMS